MAISAPPAIPQLADPVNTFRTKVAGLIAYLPTFRTEANLLAGTLNGSESTATGARNAALGALNAATSAQAKAEEWAESLGPITY